jgi:multicomponent Na+:H+ antiporter subunit D
MTSLALHPGLFLMAGAILIALTRGAIRNALALLAPLATLYLVWQVPDGTAAPVRFLDFELAPLAVDKLSRLFAVVFAIMAGGGALYSLKQEHRLELAAALFYAGAAIGVVFAGDLITVFVFWELMAIGSTLVIWSAGTPAAYRASLRYLMIHLLGGALLMAGIAGHVAQTGSIAFEGLSANAPSHWLILAGFLLNAGAPPLSAWLPDAYPRASWSGMVFLSAFTTKTAIYVLLRGFPGTEVLVYVGLFMAFYGIVYALLENDVRRLLAYSIVNQVGVMVAGIGLGTETALNGVAAHAFASIPYTALLLMAAGAVLYRTGKRECGSLGGLARSMPVTALCGIVGALSISAFPYTSGFVSKTMISQAAADGHLLWVWLLLAAASVGAVLTAGMKFCWFVFFHRDSGLRPPDAPRSMQLAMILFAALCIGVGIDPDPLYAALPYPVRYQPYTGAHVVAKLQLLLFAVLVFFLLLGWLKPARTITLDVDWLYRVFGRWLAGSVLHGLALLGGRGEQRLRQAMDTAWKGLHRHHGPEGILARTWPTGSMALWMMLLLLAYLLFYYL